MIDINEIDLFEFYSRKIVSLSIWKKNYSLRIKPLFQKPTFKDYVSDFFPWWQLLLTVQNGVFRLV